ncbi:HpcH/HpaI aldolase [Fusarium proliferatum]|uniref:HpcH/HpaI aldolase n=1 Tax=Gibberella intermedia TaxID=948311 RepID=A0A365NKE7_GIBIN|nr:HpcH/HpaI aldolase [Fusarium proliferatum]
MLLSQIKDELAEAREICRSNLVKQVMMDNQIATSFGLRLCSSTEIPLIAKRAGYSAILMNLEHAPIGIETMRDISVACLNIGITPMVVVPTCEAQWISRCLDSGAQAIVVPHVNNVEEAQVCVNAAKYPPLGRRSLTMAQPITQYTTHIPQQVVAQVINDNVMIMPMIETTEGVSNAESIAAIPGVDALFIGCADLTTDLGIAGQYDTVEFRKAIDAISTAAQNASVNGRKVFVGLGGLEGRPDLLETFAQQYSNIRFTMAGRDLSMLAAGMSRQLESIRDISSRIQDSEI